MKERITGYMWINRNRSIIHNLWKQLLVNKSWGSKCWIVRNWKQPGAEAHDPTLGVINWVVTWLQNYPELQTWTYQKHWQYELETCLKKNLYNWPCAPINYDVCSILKQTVSLILNHVRQIPHELSKIFALQCRFFNPFQAHPCRVTYGHHSSCPCVPQHLSIPNWISTIQDHSLHPHRSS